MMRNLPASCAAGGAALGTLTALTAGLAAGDTPRSVVLHALVAAAGCGALGGLAGSLLPSRKTAGPPAETPETTVEPKQDRG